MIRHILTIIWNQRSSNIWIFLELLLVSSILLMMIDSLLVDTYTYRQPTGYDIRNTYQLNFGVKTESIQIDSAANSQGAENLLRIAENLRQCPEVEAVTISRLATPYTYNRSWTSLMAESDTSGNPEIYRYHTAMLSYFQVFRMKDKEGNPLYDTFRKNQGSIVISEDLEREFFPDREGTGLSVKQGKDFPLLRIAAVSTPLKDNSDFDKSQPCFFDIWRTEQDFLNDLQATGNDIRYFQLAIRMKDEFGSRDITEFLQAQGERLEVGNVYISNVEPIREYRDEMLKSQLDTQKKKIALVSFMLVNIFFGIIGTFWLRTQSRRAEIGLRSALGASKGELRRQLYGEGLLLLLMTLPIVLFFLGNMFYLEMLDTYRLPYSVWRFLGTISGSYLLLGGMIYLGIRIPASRITRMNPADTLHYE